MKIIIDANIWISYLIGKKLKDIDFLLLNKNIEIFICTELITEIFSVIQRPKFKRYIFKTDNIEFCKVLLARCNFTTIDTSSSIPIRDPKDAYLLSLAETVGADFIISGDKDLLSIDTDNKFKVMSFKDFMSLNGQNEL